MEVCTLTRSRAKHMKPVHTHTHTHTHTRTHTHTCTCKHTHTYMFARTHTHTHVRAHTHEKGIFMYNKRRFKQKKQLRSYVCEWLQNNVRTYMLIYIHRDSPNTYVCVCEHMTNKFLVCIKESINLLFLD